LECLDIRSIGRLDVIEGVEGVNPVSHIRPHVLTG
jgi:hypothetical protein